MRKQIAFLLLLLLNLNTWAQKILSKTFSFGYESTTYESPTCQNNYSSRIDNEYTYCQNGKLITTKFTSLYDKNVTKIIRDKSGNIWISHTKGISKFDGKVWQTFTGIDNIYDFAFDNNGNIWALSPQDLYKYDFKKWTSFAGTFLSAATLGAHDLAIDTKNNVWFTNDNGLYMYDGKRLSTFQPNFTKNAFSIDKVITDSKNNVYVNVSNDNARDSLYRGFYKYTPSTNNWNMIKQTNATSVTIDSLDNIWAVFYPKYSSFRTSLEKYNGQNWTVYKFDTSSTIPIRTLTLDKKGLPWLTGYNFIYNYNGKNWTKTGRAANFSEFPDIYNIKSSCFNDSSLWMSDGINGIIQLKNNNWKTYKPSLFGVTGSTIIKELEADRSGNLWIHWDYGKNIKFDGKNYYYTYDSPTLNSLKDINNNYHSLKNGVLFIDKDDTTFEAGGMQVNKYYDNTLKSTLKLDNLASENSPHIVDLIKDQVNNIWVATQKNLYFFDGTKWTLISSPNLVRSIDKISMDRKGNIYTATYSDVLKYDGKDWKRIWNDNYYTKRNFINDVEIDAIGNVWIATQNGLYKFDGLNYTSILNFGVISLTSDIWGNTYWNNRTSFGVLYNGKKNPIKTYGISGQVFLDHNKNNKKDTNEVGIGNQRLLVLSDSLVTFTNSTGLYHITLPDTGNFIIKLLPSLGWTSSFSTFINLKQDTVDVDIPVEKDTISIDSVKLNVVSTTVGCNRPTTYSVIVENIGNSKIEGTLSLNVDTLPLFIDANPKIANKTKEIYTWAIDTLAPTGYSRKEVTFLMPGVEHITDTLHFSAKFITPSKTYFSEQIQSKLRCAYDPNNKEVFQLGSKSDSTIKIGDKQMYTVNYQNTGNDTAFTVLIRDTIDSKLDLETFQLVGSSHPYHLQINQKNRELLFRFSNILLPDSTTDLRNSMGYVSYTISTISDSLTSGKIYNTAHIIFDQNPPIQTNTTVTTLVHYLTKKEDDKIQQENDKQNIDEQERLYAYPNPAKENLFFSSSGQLDLFDNLGRTVLTTFIQDNLPLSVRHLNPGVYSAHFQMENKTEILRIVIY